ncbi:MAG: c-type cytochrome [Limimaricola sp.]|uniref:c-type cytochrome n=1 Tax=Limimaricola sp. TaxID=2211665 RepID=UPI001DC9CB61|nr:cytochrome c [Limimaricola sp.]MBI1415639.1 c-type cytochrome [Limimaricola sp.]
MHKALIVSAVTALTVAATPLLAQDMQAGMDLYNDNCAICHGNQGEGYPKEVVPDGAVRIKKLAGDSGYWDFAVFKAAVVDGTDDHGRPMRVMPAFGKTGLYEPPGQMLTDDDIKNIQAYIRSFAPQG